MRLTFNSRFQRLCALTVVALASTGAAFAASSDDDWGPLLDPETESPGLNVGDDAPDATLIDANGAEVSLASKYSGAEMTVVMFYRGGWCPYCTKSMAKWGKELGRFQENEIQVIAISPETVEHAKDSKSKQDVGFDVLVDQSTESMRKYKVAFAVPSDYTSMLRKRLKVELADWNASGEEILPAPATYVVDSNGKVLWKHADWNYSKRATPDEVLAAIDDLE